MRTRGRTTAKFIQICASQNDLFALDEDGSIYRYDFSSKRWAPLDADAGAPLPTRRITGRVERA